ERRTSTGGENGDSAQEVAQSVGAMGIEAAIGTSRQRCHLTESFGRKCFSALMEHEKRRAQNAELTGLMAKRFAILCLGSADKNHRIDAFGPGLGQRMAQKLADLGLAAEAGDAAHQALQGLAVGKPGRRLELTKAAVIGKLDVEPAQLGRSREHLGL